MYLSSPVVERNVLSIINAVKYDIVVT
jgi:hypothetical protein